MSYILTQSGIDFEVTKQNESFTLFDGNYRDIFDEFLANWPAEKLLMEKQYRLVVDGENEAKHHVTMLSNNNITDNEIKAIFEVVKTLQGTKFAIAENAPYECIRELNISGMQFAKMKEFSKNSDVILVDQMIISPNSFYSYNQHMSAPTYI